MVLKCGKHLTSWNSENGLDAQLVKPVEQVISNLKLSHDELLGMRSSVLQFPEGCLIVADDEQNSKQIRNE